MIGGGGQAFRRSRIIFAAVLIEVGVGMQFSQVIEAQTRTETLPAAAVSAEQLAGTWRASLQSGGGPVGFGLILAAEGASLQAFVTNGPETIKVPQVSWDGRQLQLGFDYFQSAIVAVLDAESGQFAGTYTREKAGRQVAQLRFQASRAAEVGPEYAPAEEWLGKWRVQFSGTNDPAIGVFRRDLTGAGESPGKGLGAEAGAASQPVGAVREAVTGSFLTPTGDYRYLAGGVRDGSLELSCFDGTHVYLFRCQRRGDDRLEGEFWSGASGHQTWVGQRDVAARLPDGFRLTEVRGEVDWGSLQFPDLEGRPRRLDDPQLNGQVRLIYLFGSWCPNCHDAAVFFGELQRDYADRGLQVLGLAFEASGDFAQDVEQVKIYARRHEIGYPLLVAGLADKEQASRSLPFLDRVRSFPTALLVDSEGRIREVYSGFNGPATGEAYLEQGQRFRERIEGLLKDRQRP